MVGDLVAERYELEELVGRGGMSCVFRARDRLLDREVALKILHGRFVADEDYVERFRREARAAAQLGHPNIVTVIDRGRCDGCEYIVLEYVEGENLKELVERTGRLPVRRALELAIQIGRALEFAHAHGLVHRDVKPQNVLLGDGRARVTDFGIARTIDVDGLTQTGTVLGTSEYIAPEQAQGLGASEQSDIYSLGVVLYELLTGSPPFTGDGFLQVALRHVNDEVPSLLERRPDVPARVAAAIERALEKDPARRFSSMAEFVEELGACGASLGGGGETTTIMPLARPRHRRPGAPAVLLLVGLLAAVAAIGVFLASRGSNPARTFSGPPPANAASVTLHGITAYDPQGTGGEHDDEAARTTDGDLSTYWETLRYDSREFGRLKSGVGLVLDAGKPVRLTRLSLATDTPGFIAAVEAGSSPEGPFTPVSDPQPVGSVTAFSLNGSRPERYYVVWISLLPPGDQAHVNEVAPGSTTLAAPPVSVSSPPGPPRHGKDHGRSRGHND